MEIGTRGHAPSPLKKPTRKTNDDRFHRRPKLERFELEVDRIFGPPRLPQSWHGLVLRGEEQVMEVEKKSKEKKRFSIEKCFVDRIELSSFFELTFSSTKQTRASQCFFLIADGRASTKSKQISVNTETMDLLFLLFFFCFCFFF